MFISTGEIYEKLFKQIILELALVLDRARIETN